MNCYKVSSKSGAPRKAKCVGCLWPFLPLILAVLICHDQVMHAADGTRTKSIASGPYYFNVIKGSGNGAGWGYNYSGEAGLWGYTHSTFSPYAQEMENLSNMVAIATGGIFTPADPLSPYSGHALFLRNDGFVMASGFNGNGKLGDGLTTPSRQPVFVTNLSEAVMISAGGQHSLALRADGTVWAWGANAGGQLGIGNQSIGQETIPAAVTNLSNVIWIAAGYNHSLALTSDGQVYAWGGNTYGQLGDNTTSTRYAPVSVPTLSNIVAVAAGDLHSLALKTDGTVWAWGNNYNGQLGVTYTSAAQKRPACVGGVSNITAISAGTLHSVALRSDGTVWAWGNNHWGQIGTPTNATVLTHPVQVTNLSGVVSISAGAYDSMAQLENGAVAAWGVFGHQDLTYLYGLGILNADANPSPVNLIKSLQYNGTRYIFPNIADTSPLELLLNKKSVLVKADGTVWSCGFNSYGALGDGTESSRNQLQQVGGITEVVGASCGGGHGLAVRRDGSVWTWGANVVGQLGDGTFAARLTPVQAASIQGITKVAAGGQHSFALDTNATLWVWGGNSYGQLGDNTTTNRTTPTHLSTPTNVTYMSAGSQHSMAVDNLGTVWTWGDNRYGQLGDGTTTRRTSPNVVGVGILSACVAVAGGDDHSLALTATGNVFAWGGNNNGQLGNNTYQNQSSPTQVLAGIKAIGAGSQFSVALSTNGIVWAWGLNASGQLGDGTLTTRLTPVQVLGLSGVTDIKVFSDHVVAIMSDTSIRVWGANHFGQLGIGNNEDQTVPVAVPGFYLSEPGYLSYTLNSLATNTSRYVRGNGNDFTYKSFVIPLDLERGVKLDDLGSNTNKFGGSTNQPWFTRIPKDTRHHLGLASTITTNVDGSQVSVYSWTNDFENPIVAFGSSAGGTPLNIDQSYRFGVYAGAQYESTNSDGTPFISPVRILVYRRSDFIPGQTNVIGPIDTNYITIPRRTVSADQTAWAQFLTNGLAITLETNGLRTTLQLVEEPPAVALTNFATALATSTITVTNPAPSTSWNQPQAGNQSGLIVTNVLETESSIASGPNTGTWGVTHSLVNLRSGPFLLTHKALSPDYCYVVEVLGAVPSGTSAASAVLNTARSGGDWCRLYSFDCDNPQPWRSVFVSRPQFNGQPLPPSYLGSSPLELTNLHAVVTNVVSLSASTFTNLDQSPELRRHPTLDNFVRDMAYDPIALANYVQNEIELTDALSYNENSGQASAPTVTQDGINRGALGVFMESQGSPIEQCALLIYLLRQAGYPAAYVFPTNNNIQMLDTRLSSLLQMQVRGAVDNYGALYTTNTLITVNYPWVVTQIGTNCVHLFPWLKDTEMIEGLNLYDYLPEDYNSGAKWLRRYIFNDPNILSLDQEMDIPSVLFPKFIISSLLQNHPGISIDDLGMSVRNRRHLYSRWQDFPTPNLVTNQTQIVVADSLTSSSLINPLPQMANVFNTVQVQIFSTANTNNSINTGELRMADLHNRKFLSLTNSGNLQLWLAAFQPGITNQKSFDATDPGLTNIQVLNLPLSNGPLFGLTVTHRRHKAINPTSVPNTNNYLGVFEQLVTSQSDRFVQTNEIVAICLNPGRVTAKMVNVYAEAYWQMQRQVQTNHTQKPSVLDAQGTAVYLMGMDYFRNVDRFRRVAERLHKSHIVSWYSEGLCTLTFEMDHTGHRVARPTLDVYLNEIAYAASGTAHADAGDDLLSGTDDFRDILLAEMGSQEHHLFNGYYASTNAISAVKLLRLAQQRSSDKTNGIVELNKNNYLTLGTNSSLGYGPTLLQNFDTNLWQKITNSFSGWDADYVRVYVTPARIDSPDRFFTKMGTVILGKGQSSFITTGDINSGQTSPYPSFSGDDPNNPWNTPSLTSFFDTESQFSSSFDTSSLAINYTSDSGLSDSTYDPQYFESSVDTSAEQNSLVQVSIDDATTYGSSSFSWDSPDIAPANLESPTYNYESAGSLNEGTISSPDEDTMTTAFSITYDWNMGTAADLKDTSIDEGDLGNSGFRQLFGLIADPVDPITGSLNIDSTDLQLAGPFPLSVRRNYSSQNFSDKNNFGFGWRINYVPYLMTTTNKVGGTSTLILHAAEEDGSVIAYRQQVNTNAFIPTATDNPTLNNNSPSGIGSINNIFNAVITRSQSGSNTFYTLVGPDGSSRVYLVMTNFAIPGATKTIIRARPYLISWQDNRGNSRSFSYGTNATAADFGQLIRIQCSNGNYVGFYYNTFGYIIEAYTGDGRRVTYDYDGFGDLVAVTLPDNSQIHYEYNHYIFTHNNKIYHDSDHSLTRQIKPQGRVLQNIYDTERRVVAQLATVGPDLDVYTNASFTYSNSFAFTNSATNYFTGYTLIQDVNQQTTRYDYVSNLITKITDPLGQFSLQNWYSNATAGSYQRSLQSTVDKRGLTNAFLYDASGNVTNLTISGTDLTGDTTPQTSATFVFTYTNNLIATSTDPLGNVTKCFYGNTSYPFLPTSIESYGPGNVPIRTNTFIYTNFSTAVTNGPLSFTNSAYGMLTRTIRADHSPDAATNDSFFDGRGWLTNQIAYSGSSTIPNLTNVLFYNSRGELVQQTDVAGRSKVFAYDDLGNPTAREVYEASAIAPLSSEFFYFNQNSELTWYDGPRYDPEDYVWHDYDGAGRQTQEIHWRSRSKSDGSGVEAETGDNLFATAFYEWDKFGNQTAVKDQYGNTMRMAYDAIGQLIDRRRYAPNSTVPLTLEQFGYEPGGQVSAATNVLLGGYTTNSYTTTGKLKRQVNPDGSVRQLTYDLLGRVHREYLPNGNYWETTYDDANRKITRTFSADSSQESQVFDRRGNVLFLTNVVGDVFTTSYDGLDRVAQSVGPGTAGHQQIANYTYDTSGKQLIATNALGEFTITTYDALGRVITNAVYGVGGSSPVSIASTTYGTNRNSISTTVGSGSGAVTATVFTDTYGKTVLTQSIPSAGVTNYSINTYDVLENLVASRDELGQTNSYIYDALNRLQTQILPDGATVAFTYNPANSIVSRTMPSNLVWSATYDSANRITSEQLKGGTLTNRFFTYQYYNASSPNVGLLQTKIDVFRGVTNNLGYDSYLRLTTNSTTGIQPDQNVSCTYLYDRRGLATNSTHADGTTVDQVLRTFDAYSEITREQVLLGSTVLSDFSQSWDIAGRRIQLAQAGATSAGTINFSNRADGFVTNINQGGQAFRFNYGDNGLLASRSNAWRVLTVGQRDGRGRILSETNLVGSGNASVEMMTWRPNSTLASYAATRSGTGAWNESRVYQYNSRNQLIAEPIGVSTGSLATNNYSFDSNLLGVLTRAQWTGNLGNLWQENGLNSLDQITTESWSQSSLTLRANGSAINAASVSAKLDGSSLSGVSLGNGRWFADLSLSPGSHTLAATANYAVGNFSSTANNTFSVASANSVTNYYDGAGNVTNRLFASGKSQAITWDGFGRLTSVVQRDSSNNGFNWSAIYDCLGRRLRTINIPVVANQLNTAMTLTIDSLYDPQVEFQELAVALNGSRTWKVLGPDLNGQYAGLQGVGGLEATIRESDGLTTPVLNDAFGNVLSTVNPLSLAINWSPVRVTGYGPALGYQAPVLGVNTSLADTQIWRNRRLDPTGFYWLGANYYDPLGQRFLAPDPLGHEANMGLYQFCGGDPVNRFDPDGRLGKGAVAGWNSDTSPYGSSGAFDAGYFIGGVLSAFREGWKGGEQIVDNTLTFGATDALGLTDTSQLQGADYTGSRILATGGRELLITAATLGAAQAYRATGYGAYGLLAWGGEAYSTYRNVESIDAGLDNLQNGNAWGFAQIGLGALGLRGNYASATQLIGYQLASDSTRLGCFGNLTWRPLQTVSQTRGYDTAFEVRLNPSEFKLTDTGHFEAANEAVQAQLLDNPAAQAVLRARYGDDFVESFLNGQRPSDWTWHHALTSQAGGEAGWLHLVDRADHSANFWLYHPEGFGGYEQWARPAGAPPR